MKAHITTGPEFDTITVDLVDGTRPLALVTFGAIQLITDSEDDGDQLIRAGEMVREFHRQARARADQEELPYTSPYGAPADEVVRDAEPYPQTGAEAER